MMKTTMRILLALAASGMLMLSGCASPEAAADLMAGVKAAGWPQPPERLDADFQAAVMNFSWDMFREASANGGNVLISPASIYLALAMTMNGAKGDTLAAMSDALRSGGLALETLDAACRDWIGLLRRETEKTKLSVANSIWFRREYDVADAFLQTNADYFDAGARALDFDSRQAVDTVNGWVREQTRGTIEKIVEEIKSETVMYLINAVYFKSDWQTPFDANRTDDGEFLTPEGTVTVPFMNRDGEMSYLSSGGAQGVTLPYDDGRFSFFAVLPPEGTGVREYVAGLDGSAIGELLSGMASGYIALSLPKFETRFENSLTDELSAMGMGVAFTDRADLSGISAQGVSNLFISDVLHKTFCRVDELGTEAAAVTSVEVSLTAMPAYDAQIRFDRPFVYGIVDTATGTPLFLGIMEDPSK